MKLPYPLPLPRREDGSLFPALLAVLLAALLLAQMMIVDPVVLPEPALATARPAMVKPFVVDSAVAQKLIVQSDVFSPTRSAGAGAGASAGGPLGGVMVAGSVSVAGRSYAMVVAPGGRISRMAPGGTINGWRLMRLDAGGAHFQRGSERIDLPYGGQAPQATLADEESE